VQALTAAQQEQARKNVYAAPFDAMAFSGMQLNGGIEVSQEWAHGTAFTVSGAFVCDGWKYFKSGTMACVASAQVSTALQSLGFNNFLYLTVSTAQPSIGVGDYVGFYQSIEGYRVARLGWGTANARPLTIGFWASHSRAGTYSVSFRNSAQNRSYAATYSHAGGGPQWTTITVPGDTTGTWLTTNGVGLYVVFVVSGHPSGTFTTPTANAWYAGNYLVAPGQVNGVAATSDTFAITGVVVLPGNEAPNAARSPYIMRAYDTELALALRYFETGTEPFSYRSLPSGITAAYDSMRFLVKKRVAPTMTAANWQYFSGGGGTAFTPAFSSGVDYFAWTFTSFVNWGGWTTAGQWTADARI